MIKVSKVTEYTCAQLSRGKCRVVFAWRKVLWNGWSTSLWIEYLTLCSRYGRPDLKFDMTLTYIVIKLACTNFGAKQSIHVQNTVANVLYCVNGRAGHVIPMLVLKEYSMSVLFVVFHYPSNGRNYYVQSLNILTSNITAIIIVK